MQGFAHAERERCKQDYIFEYFTFYLLYQIPFVSCVPIHRMASSKSTTPLLDSLESGELTLTPAEYIKSLCPGFTGHIPRAHEPLITDRFPASEVRQVVNDYLQAGAIDSDWERATSFYSPDIIYIPNNTGAIWITQPVAKKSLINQIALVPGGKYNRFFHYRQWKNTACWYEWNDFRSASGKVFSVPNWSLIVYDGHSKFRMAVDLYDMFAFSKRLLAYFEDDMLHGGTAGAHFIKMSLKNEMSEVASLVSSITELFNTHKLVHVLDGYKL